MTNRSLYDAFVIRNYAIDEWSPWVKSGVKGKQVSYAKEIFTAANNDIDRTTALVAMYDHPLYLLCLKNVHPILKSDPTYSTVCLNLIERKINELVQKVQDIVTLPQEGCLMFGDPVDPEPVKHLLTYYKDRAQLEDVFRLLRFYNRDCLKCFEERIKAL